MHPVFRFLRCVVNTAFRWLMLLLLLCLGSVLGQAQIPNVFWCPCLIISFDVGVSAGEVLEGLIHGFREVCPVESYI